jgi:hypothetical protein
MQTTMQTMALQQNRRRQCLPGKRQKKNVQGTRVFQNLQQQCLVHIAEAAKREAKMPMLQVTTHKTKGEGHKARRV